MMMTPYESAKLALLERLVVAQEGQAAATWWAAHSIGLFTLLLGVFVFWWNARHQIQDWWSPAGAEQRAVDRVVATERARRKAIAKLDREQEPEPEQQQQQSQSQSQQPPPPPPPPPPPQPQTPTRSGRPPNQPQSAPPRGPGGRFARRT